jgi:DnaJ-class molecular chaperone
VEERDLYADLGLSKGASEEEIRKAYRRLARQHHPDVNPGDAAAEERFKRISFANDVLSDAEKRKRYDEFGISGLADGFDPEQTRAYRRWSQGARQSPFSHAFERGDLDDLLGDLFGMGVGGQRRPRGPARARDVEGEVSVDFLDAVRGGEVRVEMQRPDGSTRALRIKIPPGADEGTRIRLAGQGEPAPAPGGKAGDLLLRLRVRPHPFFRRHGADLLLDLPVTLPELIKGASVEVPTPDGPVTMKIPPQSQSGRKLRLRGKGAARRRGGGRGDLLVTLVVRLPEAGGPELEEVADRLQEIYADEDVRSKLRGGPE